MENHYPAILATPNLQKSMLIQSSNHNFFSSFWKLDFLSAENKKNLF